MASTTTDIGALSPEQQDALQQYTAVTDQNVEAAIPLLRRSEWNIQIAISRFFDGEPTTDPLAEALAAQAQAQAPQDVRRQEVLMNGFSSPHIQQSPDLEPAPRIVPQPENQVSNVAAPPFVLRLLFTPFSIVYTLLARCFRLGLWAFPFLPRIMSRFRGANTSRPNKGTAGRRPLKPQDSAARFIREFEEDYGQNELPFFENGYAQALDTAKRDLKFLLVVILSPEHDDTSSYVRETLLAPEVVAFFQNHREDIILWAGSVRDSEAYQVANGLRCSKFPFAALICHTPSTGSTAMSIIARVTGPTPPSTFLNKIQRAMEQYSSGLTSTRRLRQEVQATRSIREQQNSAYERSLAQDRERSRVQREESERKKLAEEADRKAEEEKEKYQNDLTQWRRWKATQVGPEPGADVKDAVRISLRMADGERVVRKFSPATSLEELYAFVECYDLLQDGALTEKVEQPSNFTHEYKFRLVSPMPREVYELASGGSLRERIGRSGNLIVERTALEEESDGDEE